MPAFKGPVAMLTTPPMGGWYLVCTKSTDTLDPKNMSAQKYIGYNQLLRPDDVMQINIMSKGPRLAEAAGKYQIITTRGFATAQRHTTITQQLEKFQISIPSIPNLNVPSTDYPTIKIVIALSSYDGSETPSIIYLPESNPDTKVDGKLQFHFETKESVVIAAATWDQANLLKDGINLEPFGVGFTINTGEATKSVDLQQVWRFSPMTLKMYGKYLEALYPDK